MTLLTPLLYVALTAPAADTSAEQILGKWTHTRKEDKAEITVTLEFTKGGDVTVELKTGALEATKVKGKYKVLDDKTLEIETLDLMNKPKSDKGEFSVT